ncbi:signal peptidase I [Microgenomates group bacterium RBG_16_45_19]|nr:MAG: signal peptidase I [Microgenomates group bacterium RBG_16_45_19]
MSTVFRTIGGFFLDIIETVVIALSIFLIVYLFLMQPHQVNGDSMIPNFHHGEYLLTDKISYKFNQPKRGDVVVFRSPPQAQCPEGAGCDFIKRVIGLPGDTVTITNNHVVVNNQPLDETYIGAAIETRPGAYMANGPVTIPTGQYFVLGDNRPHSSDSRTWGPVEMGNIVGHVFFRYWPLNRIGQLEKTTYAGF